MDETFVARPPEVVADALADAALWRRYWPDLRLRLYANRGAEGLRWTVGGSLVGTMEVWLEPMLDGTLLHYFLKVDSVPPRQLARELRRRRLAAKQAAFALKLTLESGRPPGEPPQAP